MTSCACGRTSPCAYVDCLLKTRGNLTVIGSKEKMRPRDNVRKFKLHRGRTRQAKP